MAPDAGRMGMTSDTARPRRWLVNDEDVIFCDRCGAPLLDDPDDDATGGPDGTPLCGECDRNRNFAADFEVMDMMDGDLDGTLDF
jgi:hypothetical protein